MWYEENFIFCNLISQYFSIFCVNILDIIVNNKEKLFKYHQFNHDSISVEPLNIEPVPPPVQWPVRFFRTLNIIQHVSFWSIPVEDNKLLQNNRKNIDWYKTTNSITTLQIGRNKNKNIIALVNVQKIHIKYFIDHNISNKYNKTNYYLLSLFFLESIIIVFSK